MAAVDGSPYTSVVAWHAAELARIAGARVLAAYVVDERLVCGPLARMLADELDVGDQGQLAETFTAVLQRHGQESLAAVEAICAQEGVRVSTTVEHGRPAEILAEMAPLYDLAVVGSLGWGAQFGASPLGTTAAELLRLAMRPVMLVREQYRRVRHALVGYDGSPEAARALLCVLGMAKPGGWRVTVVTASPSKARVEALRTQMQRLEGTEAVPHEVVLRRGAPDHVLIELAAELGADLVVVGSRGTGKRGRGTLGSTAEALCRHAGAPVLICR